MVHQAILVNVNKVESHMETGNKKRALHQRGSLLLSATLLARENLIHKLYDRKETLAGVSTCM
jgi:hypothetical protein